MQAGLSSAHGDSAQFAYIFMLTEGICLQAGTHTLTMPKRQRSLGCFMTLMRTSMVSILTWAFTVDAASRLRHYFTAIQGGNTIYRAALQWC